MLVVASQPPRSVRAMPLDLRKKGSSQIVELWKVWDRSCNMGVLRVCCSYCRFPPVFAQKPA